MLRLLSILLICFSLGGWAAAQVDQLPSSDKGPGTDNAPPRYDRSGEAGESSSRDTKIDISAPKDDTKSHPNSADPTADADTSDVTELHPYNPHKALKDIEVGDYYFRRKNYRAALDRYREALEYKPNDAISNFRMAECFVKLENPAEAVSHYQDYLKILPHGPLSGEAQKALEKLNKTQAQNGDQIKR